uniref:Uncharacterized protein n=1 Tax=Stegastes partitus TaxID=144197 RepID=A0A3B4ZJT7_9TELE
IRPISNTVDIFVTGLDAASFSLLASNFGLKRSTGSRYANEGISFSSSFVSSAFSSSLLTASHIFVALGVSLVWFSTFISLCRDQPLILDFSPFGFFMTLRRGSASGRVLLASFVSSEDSAFSSLTLSSVPDSAAGTLIGGTMLVFEPSGLILVESIVFIGSFGSETAFVSVIALCSGVSTLSLPKSFLTDFRDSRSAPLSRGPLVSGAFVFGLVS